MSTENGDKSNLEEKKYTPGINKQKWRELLDECNNHTYIEMLRVIKKNEPTTFKELGKNYKNIFFKGKLKEFGEWVKEKTNCNTDEKEKNQE
ncbi:MAG: hypothetical protein LBC63_03570, partial [Holophagales bacterium]|nr:hypothetical protein [Holophagales bacterium]